MGIRNIAELLGAEIRTQTHETSSTTLEPIAINQEPNRKRELMNARARLSQRRMKV